MAILQAYQADVLKEMDEGTDLTPEAVKELRRATDLALRATKHTARAVGRSMAGSVAVERHLWLNLTEIREKEKVFLLDAPISQSGLFGEAVSSVVEKFRSATTQSAALKQFMPRRTRDHSTPSSSVSREHSLPRKEPFGGSGAQATHPPATAVWGARGRSFPHQRPRRRFDLKRPNRPAASGNLGRSWPSGRNKESLFTVTRRGQTAKAFLLASNALSSLKSVWELWKLWVWPIHVLPVWVQETIASARAPATRKLYSSKWGVFESWCLARAIDPVNCPVGPVLEFLQERLTAGAAATTLRVYVAAIAARRELVETPLGRHRMVSAIMRGVRRLRPVWPTAVPSWDLSVVLEGLVTATFEPLESASERILTLKVTLLLKLTSLKRVGDLQAFSSSEKCMDFALVKVTLRPRPGYVPKVLSKSFRSQVVTLHSFHPPPFA